jgi:hypothetical protein|nr:S16 family serine protease [Kofleriaceae bacterium]
MRIRALGLVLLAACGSSQHATGGGGSGAAQLGPATTKTYAVLGAKADAKAGGQAVILGTDDHNGSTVLPLPNASSKAVVDAMWVKLGGTEPPSGGSTPVKLATAPNVDGSVQVGVYEDTAGGVGPQWRAGVWMSAFVAATTLGKDLTDYTFSAASGGYIDGASASGLMAGGFLAAMTGADVDPTVTMTGIINPDGTIGPVGGIPEKFAGSIAKGKKKIGFPIGMRYARSEASGEMVDLVELAKKQNVEAVEVANVQEAYHLLTGKTLPQTLPVTEADMTLDASTSTALEGKYVEWQHKLAGKWDEILKLEQAGRLPPSLEQLRDRAKRTAELAEKLHDKHLVAAAYAKILEAWADTDAASQAYDLARKVESGDIKSAIADIAAIQSQDDQTKKVFETIGAIKPKTLGGHLQMMAAFQAALRAWGAQVFAKQSVAQATSYLSSLDGTPPAELQSPEAEESIVSSIVPAIALAAKMRTQSELALQIIDVEKEDSVSYLCSIPNMKRLSTSFRSAGGAAVNYFDELLLGGAGGFGDYAKQQIAMIEPDYLNAMIGTHLQDWEGLPQQLKKEWGDNSFAWNLLELAASELAYYNASALIAKYYSLGIETAHDGQIVRVERDKAFANMLATAERAARSSARGARIAAGAIPVQAKLSYQLAEVEKDGDLGQRVEALGELWTANAYAQTAVMLARN